MVASTATLTRAADDLTQRTILLAARVALRLWAIDSDRLAIDLWEVIDDEAVSDPNTGYRLRQCVCIMLGPTTLVDPGGQTWSPEVAYTAVMSAMHVLINFRLSHRTKFHA